MPAKDSAICTKNPSLKNWWQKLVANRKISTAFCMQMHCISLQGLHIVLTPDCAHASHLCVSISVAVRTGMR